MIHGTFGEDGELQRELEDRCLPFVGSDSQSSQLAFDKAAAKTRWKKAGLPTAAWALIRPGDIPRIPIERPWMLKPNRQGSSVGVEIVSDEVDWQTRLALHSREWQESLVEPRLFGREFTVGILFNSALPLIEIRSAAEFFDFHAKYERSDTTLLVAPQIDSALHNCLVDVALTAFHVLGCRDFGRVDLIVDDRSGIQLLEVNTIPGFTSHSLLPLAAKASGKSETEVVRGLVETAWRRGRPGK